MKTGKQVISLLLALVSLISVIPVTAPAAEAAGTPGAATSTGSSSGVTITQTAEWDPSVTGETVANVTLQVTSEAKMQTPTDVVILIDHSALQPLGTWKSSASELVDILSAVPGTRFALVSYASTAEKLLDFTSDYAQVKSAIAGIASGGNNNAYAGFLEVQKLLQTAAPKKCVAFFSTLGFNMNIDKTEPLMKQVRAAAPIYSYHEFRNMRELALVAADSPLYTDLTVTARLNTGIFLPTVARTDSSNHVSGSLTYKDGVLTFRPSAFRMGQSFTISFSGKLTDRTNIDAISVAQEASVTAAGLSVKAGGVFLDRNGYTVTYDGNGADEGAVLPVDNGSYGGGAEVTVKPASMRREGWNFSGWTSPTLTIQNGKFNISGNTELKAAWGRAYVKLSSRTANTEIKGTNMLSRSEIEKLKNKAFYGEEYWPNLASVTLHQGENVPLNCRESWDITAVDDSNTPGAVMAWVIPASETGKYDLHISGQDGLTAPTDCNNLFKDCTASQFNQFEILNTSNVTSMRFMFFGCISLTTLDVSGWVTSNVTDMYYMFYRCRSLTTLGVSNWDTSKVTNMNSIFSGCSSLTTLNVNGWNTSNVTDMSSMFYKCSKLTTTTLDVGNWDTSKVTNMAAIFSGCSSLTTLNVSGWDTSKVTNMGYMFEECSSLSTLDVSGWDTSKVTSMQYMFYKCHSLTTLVLSNDERKWDTSKVTDMRYMFCECRSLTTLVLSSWDTSKVTDMQYMFHFCSSLTTLDVSNWDTSNVTNMAHIFCGCSKLTPLNVSNWDTSKVMNMSYMFSGCNSLTALVLSNDERKWDTSNVTSMSYMFNGCTNLESLDLSTWDTSKVMNMANMFSGCSSLTTLDVSNWKTSKVTYMSYMFYGCTNLKSLDLSTWDMTNVKSINGMFYLSNRLTNINRKKLVVADGCTIDSWRGVLLLSVILCTTNDEQLDPPTTTAALLPSEYLPEPSSEVTEQAPVEPESFPDEAWLLPEKPEAPDPEYQVLTARAAQYAQTADAADDDLYANVKTHKPWNGGRVVENQQIDYTLELQYLNAPGSSGGVSGDLTVTNQIPEGLILVPGSVKITGQAQRIVTGDGGSVRGQLIKDPAVSADNVLTFTVTGLSAGAKYIVTYSCTVPATVTGNVVYLNTASVDDNGLIDYADPVQHYFLSGPNESKFYTVTYEYAEPFPSGATPPPAETYLAGTTFTPPEPSAPGYIFNGWEQNGVAFHGGTIEDDITLAGIWTPLPPEPPVKVTYRFEGDRPASADFILEGIPETYPANSTTTLPGLPAIPEGYTFDWQLPPGLTVDADGRFNVGTTDITIVGQWSKTQYTVKYAYQNAPADAAPLPPEELHSWGTRVPQAPAPSSTAEYLFLGWDGVETDMDGTFLMPMENVTITGNWIPRPETAKEILVDPNGGTWNGSSAQSAISQTDYEAQIKAGTFPNAVKSGSTFQGWTETADPDGIFLKILTASWQTIPAPLQDYLVTFDSRGGTPVTSQTVNAGGKVSQPAAPTREGHKFLGWYRDPSGSLVWNFNSDVVTENLTLYAKWEQPPNTPAHGTSSGSSGSNIRQYVITAKANAGGSIDPAGQISVPAGGGKTFAVRPSAGSSVKDVLVDGKSVGAVNAYTFENVQADHTIEVFFTRDSSDSGGVNWLNTKDHIAFLRGFPGRTFHPYDYMTRAEIAQMFFNLLEDKSVTASAFFSDVPANAWYADAVNSLKALGVVRGVGHRRFLPEQAVSRAEFTAIAVRFAKETHNGQKKFKDVNQEDWFYNQVMSATGLGWIKGYKDGTFRPDAPILRAEAAAIVNRMLGRKADRNYTDQHVSEMRMFPDVASNYWAYYDILEATNAHDYHVDQKNSEIWEKLASSRKKN